MGSKLSLIALGAGAYLAFAVATFPASVAHRWFAPDMLALAAVEGSVWRGHAAYGAVGGFAFSDLRWQLQPLSLLTGKLGLSAEARLPDGLVRSEVVLAGNRVTLSDVDVSGNLATLEGALPVTGVRGNVRLDLDRLELVDGWPVSASGTLRIANLMAPPLIPVSGVKTIALGNYLARLTTSEPDGIVAVVNDEGGPLELEGRASLSPGRVYELEARIRPRPEAADALVEGLRFMDPESRTGQYTVRYQQQL